MSIPLGEALQGVVLQSGRTYRCQVNGLLVELRVFDPATAPPPVPFAESDIRLDAWAELPEPVPTAFGTSQLGELDVPDLPDLPPDEEPS